MGTDGSTFINPIGLGMTLLMGVLMILLPRRWALMPVILLTCFMTLGQRIVIAGLDFTMLRILMAFACARLVLRLEIRALQWNAIDKAIVWWVLFSVLNYTLNWRTGEAFVNRLGFTYNILGTYFVFRFLIRDLEDVKKAFKMTAFFIVPLAMAMGFEYATERNIFAVFGGVHPVTQIREGVLRCQGPFAHPILAGTFGATLLPLFVGLWHQGRGSRLLAGLAILSSTIIVATSGSSGPILSFLAAGLGLAMWWFRKWMRALRWGLVLGVVALDLVMKASVWFLIARVGVLSGSTAYHRAAVIDNAIKNFSEWWLVGTRSTAHWGYGMTDITNEYVSQAVNGGLITVVLFILVIAFAFRAVGRAVAGMKGAFPAEQRLFWGMGVALFAHAVTYLSVAYFDQNFVNWYLLLAMIASTTGPWLGKRSTAKMTHARVPLDTAGAVDSVSAYQSRARHATEGSRVYLGKERP